MTEPQARPTWPRILLAAIAVAWFLAQAATVNVPFALAGFNLKSAASTTHNGYALLNVSAWLIVVIGVAAVLVQRGRWRRLLAALAAGSAAAGLQAWSAGALGSLASDPANTGLVDSAAMRAGATAELSALLAAVSTALLCTALAAISFPTGERGASFKTELRQAGVLLARSLRPRNFNVLSWIFGPVFQADVRVTGRRRLTYVGRALYLVILLAILSIGWLGVHMDMDTDSSARRLQQMQELAPQLASFLLWTQFALLLFIAPLLTAPVICQERTGRTLPALLTTPLTAAQIIFGKLAGRLTMVIILILLSVPLLLGVRVYGGLDGGYVLKVIAVTISATILAASLGLLASIWSKRATTAGAVAFVMLAAQSFGVPLLLVAVVFGFSGPPASWVWGISPFLTMIVVTAEAMGEPPPFAGVDIWIHNVALNLGLAAAACLIATFAFRRVMIDEANGRTISLKKRRRKKRARIAPTPTPPGAEPTHADPIHADPRAHSWPADDDGETIERASRIVGTNPVAWREIRQSTFGGSRLRTFLAALAAVALVLLLNLYFGPGEEGLHYVLFAALMVVLCASAAVAASGAIAGEREAGTWTILLTTPLSGPEILLGKFLGACRRCWLLPIILLFDGFLAIAGGKFSPVFLLHLVIIVPATILFLCGTGTLFSLFFRKLTTAGVVNLGLAVVLWIGLPMLLGFLSAMAGWNSDLDVVFSGLVAINPVPMTVVALAGATDASYNQVITYDMPHDQMSFAGFTLLLIVGMGLLAAVGAAALILAAAQFRRASERTS